MQRLGQHFLKDRAVLKKIIDTASLSSDDTVLEIGPGTGVLTTELARRAKRVIAIEKDRALCEALQKNFASAKNVEVACGDILHFDPVGHAPLAHHYKVVANIPYYLTGRLLRLMGEEWPQPTLAVLLLQEEVARRIGAAPPKMSRVAVSVQLWATPKIVRTVPPRAFTPPPKVNSAILRLTPHTAFAERPLDKGAVRVMEVARNGFSHPRKLLRSNLSKKYPREKVAAAFSALGIAPSARAQELSVVEWQQLSKQLT